MDVPSQETQVAGAALNAFAERFGSTQNKAKLTLIGATAIAFSYVFLFAEGVSGNFVALAWPGMVLCSPFGYDVLVALLNKSK